jgi:hypothetical protein
MKKKSQAMRGQNLNLRVKMGPEEKINLCMQQLQG